MRRIPIALAGLALAGCACGEGTALFVDLRTDLVPDVEFQLARVEVFSGASATGRPAHTEDAAVLATYDFFAGRRIAEIEGIAPGAIMVRTRLLDAPETLVAERLTRIDVTGRHVIAVIVTRDCRGVSCPSAGGSAAAITCLGGRCESPECVEGTEPVCAGPECDADADCDVTAVCATARCVGGVCIAESRDDRCAPGEYCDPDVGCRTRPGDGDDGGAPDAGPGDAGTDAGCSGASCDDGDACNGVETCVEGACAPGSPMPCDDGIACTRDGCASSTCTHVPEDGMCALAPGGRCDVATGGCQYATCTPATCVADGCTSASCSGSVCMRTSLCTASQMCCAGACVALGCDDGNPCTDDACGASACTHTPNTSPCGDGDACTTGDACSGGTCRGGMATTCSDGNACTDDGCSPASGCTFTPNTIACDDGAFCTVTDRCAAGACSGSGSPCSGATPSCDEMADLCFACRSDADCPARELGAWSGCEYPDDCRYAGTETRTVTTWSCRGAVCEPSMTVEPRACLRMTDGDRCEAPDVGPWGACEGASDCANDGLQSRTVTDWECRAEICQMNPRTEQRSCTRPTDGLPCDDGLTCNGFSRCLGGTCTAGAPPCEGVCLTCVEGAGCVTEGDGSPCGDGGFCDSGDCRRCDPCVVSNCTIFGNPGCDDGSGCRECGILPV